MTQSDSQEQPAASGANSEAAPLVPSETPPLPAQLVFDRLHEQIDQEPAHETPPAARPVDTLGQQLRRWRLRRGYSRRRLTTLLAWAPGRLLVVECAIARPDEITADELARLATRVETEAADPELAAAIAGYRATLPP